MEIAILGPLVVRDDDRDVSIPGQRVQRLLGRLAVDAPRAVSIGELVRAVWAEGDDLDTPEEAGGVPSNVTNALQSLVSRLRRALGDGDKVVQRPGGYALDLAPTCVDVHAFEHGADAARAALRERAWDRAADEAATALALWRGDPLPEAGDAEYARALRVRWDEARLDLLADGIEADVMRGRSAGRLAELESLVAAVPLRERFTWLLMRSLTELGRYAEALAAYERHRSYLAEELGTDPAPALQAQHLALLRGEVEAQSRRPQHNLPAAVTRFLGREPELLQVNSLLRAGRLVTIVGPGGSGKTRLAVEAALAAITVDGSAERPSVDEAWLVELASVTQPTAVVGAFLSALGLRETQVLERPGERVRQDDEDRLLDALVDSDVLLVVDNCEHLLDDVAGLMAMLLARCPRLRILATSREPLGIAGEALCPLAPLGLPSTGVSAGVATTYPSVQLFAERAVEAAPGFAVDAGTVADVVEVVRRLDGLPLAIELAAARLRVLPLGEIARRLNDRFALLTSGSRTALPRHRTLRAVVDWSWELMSEQERELAMRLSVFPAGATVEAAAAVGADGSETPGSDSGRRPVADVLDALVDKSWIRPEPGLPLRYRMLETMREYGIEKLADQLETVRAQHARFFADLVRRTEPRLRTADQIDAIQVLTVERDNITTAMRFLGETGDARATLDMAVGLAWYWVMMSGRTDPVTWLSFALGVPGETDRVTRIVAEVLLAVSSMDPDAHPLPPDQETPAVVAAVERMAELNEEIQQVDSSGLPMVSLVKCVLAMFAEDAERLPAAMDEALTSGDPWVRACSRMFRANISENAGDVGSMRADIDQAVKEFSEIGDRWGLASTLSVRGQLLTLEGDLDGAVAALEEAQRYLHQLGARGDEQMAQIRLVRLELRQGDIEAARRRAHLMTELAEQRGSSIHAVIARSVLAAVEVTAGDEAAARRWASTLTTEVADLPTVHPLRGHGRALALTTVATIELAFGTPDAALPLLVEAYPHAVATKDLPILAGLGVATAEYAAQVGALRDAGEILGAAARLRGADDWTDIGVRQVVRRLRDDPAADFESAYAAGRDLDQDQAKHRLDPSGL